jgi:xanthosine utilization system XapX-like protein
MRGALVIGLLWGGGWATCGVALAAWRVLFGRPHLADPAQYLGRFMGRGAIGLGVSGFAAGVAFALLLSRAERGRDVASLSVRRATLWGTFAGALVGLVATVLIGIPPAPVIAVIVGIMAVVGSGFASATVRIAQGDAAANRRIGKQAVFTGPG